MCQAFSPVLVGFVCLFICKGVSCECYMCMWGPMGARLLDSLELETPVVQSCLLWVLGTELVSSRRAGGIFSDTEPSLCLACFVFETGL